MGHHTKDKGDLAVLQIAAECAKQGYLVLFPATEHAAFDLVVFKENRFSRIQCKHKKISRGTLSVTNQSVWNDKHGTHVKKASTNAFEAFGVYCPDTGKCYFIRYELKEGEEYFHKTLRTEHPKNNQKQGVSMADDFTSLEKALSS